MGDFPNFPSHQRVVSTLKRGLDDWGSRLAAGARRAMQAMQALHLQRGRAM